MVIRKTPCPHCGGYNCCGGQGGITFTPYDTPLSSPVPHKCPVCEGSGKIWCQEDKSLTSAANRYYKLCHSCLGSGIVWSPEGGFSSGSFIEDKKDET